MELGSMEKEFVPYKLAVKLKELGFDEECLMLWEHTDFWTNLVRPEEFKKVVSERYCQAPLWQQAFDWCLDKLKLIESYAIIIDSDSYSLVIMDYYYNDIKENLTQSSTKEECIKKLIELCEKN